MANFAALGAFVQATILDPATGKLSVYEPLVITQGTQPAVNRSCRRCPGRGVTVDFGFNGTNLNLVGANQAALNQGNCVNGLNGSIFGQVAFCNGTGFFQAVNQAEAAGTLTVPAAGTSAKTGPALSHHPVVRDDRPGPERQRNLHVPAQRQRPDGTGQRRQRGRRWPGAKKINNGSDNLLLDAFLDPIMGCTPMEAPDLTNAGTMGTSQALDEIAAAKDAAAPIALVPENDEMVLVNTAASTTKTNLYRSNVDQAPISAANDAAQPGQLLPEHGQRADAVPGQEPDPAHRRPDPGPRPRQQPVHVHGQPAEHVVHQPRLPELRAHEPGDGDPGR